MPWRLKSPALRLFTLPLIRAQIKENITAPRHWPLCREFTGEFPVQMASNAENVSIWWRHHEKGSRDVVKQSLRLCNERTTKLQIHTMMTSTNRNIFRFTSPLCGELPGNSPHRQRPVAQSFGIFFDLRRNKRLSEQSRGLLFETPSRSLLRHCNDKQLPGHLFHHHLWLQDKLAVGWFLPLHPYLLGIAFLCLLQVEI